MRKRLLPLVIVCVLCMSVIAFANAMEPPSILVIVPDAPKDLTLSMAGETGWTVAKSDRDPLETRYRFYHRDLAKKQPYHIHVKSSQFDYTLKFEGKIRGYDNIFTLDLSKQSLSEGKDLKRSITLVGMRLGLTLVIEGSLFYLMGYRRLQSWLIFLGVNVLTQGVLNVWLNDMSPAMSYVMLTLIYGELFVYTTELVFMTGLIYEKRMRTNALFIVLANTLSLFLGGWLICQFSV